MYGKAQANMYNAAEFVGWGILKITEAAIRFFASYAKPTSQAAAFLLTAGSAWNLMSDPENSILLVFLSHIFVIYPIASVALRILSLIPQGICKIIVYYLDCRRRKAWGSKEGSGKQESHRYSSNTEGGSYRTGSRTGTQNGNKNGSGHTGSAGKEERDASNDGLSKALRYFCLTIPYTEIQAKQRWKELMKKAHPDAGGSDEDAKKINAYYEILKKYAK